ncbi:MAG TPA: glycosyltransferase family 2 protein [Dehalococcoidia bacterium]|nr:glycosyltransferase family 2 protein [Dehalococcoidia bacterium]
MPNVSVVVVTHNSAADVGRCLTSLRAHVTGVTFEAIVVDNASDDGTADLVEREHPWARVVRRATNGGLSRAINDGVAASSGAYVMALNADTHVESDALAPLVAYLRAHPDAGVAAPKLLDDDGALQLSCRAFPGYGTALFNRYSLLTRLLPANRLSSRYLMTDFDHASVRDVDWVSGAALMTPRGVLEEVGGWDAGFFLFNEDVDLCRRIRDAGYRVVYVADAVVYHTIGISMSTSPRIVIARHRSMWRYYRKHLRGNPVRDALTGAAIAARCAVLLASHAVRAALRGRRERRGYSSSRLPGAKA